MKNYIFLLYFKFSLYCVFIFIATFLVFLIFFNIDYLSQSLAHFSKEVFGDPYVKLDKDKEIEFFNFVILVISASTWVYIICLFIEYIDNHKGALLYYIKHPDEYRKIYNRRNNKKDAEISCLKDKNSLPTIGNIKTLLEQQNKANSKFNIKISVVIGFSGIILTKIVDKIF